MEFQISSAVDLEASESYVEKLYKYRDNIRSKVCRKTRQDVMIQFPVVANLEDNLEIFRASEYGKVFKEEVSWWLE